MKKIHHDWLDYARFLAAMSVCWFHYCANGIRNGKISSISDFGVFGKVAEYGYLGVDLFFVISGFVVLYGAINKSADEFVVARVVRIYPAYIFCMTLTAIVLIVSGKGVGLLQYIANLTMIASYFGFENMDGVYWTLALELIFYSLIWVIIFTGQVKRVEVVVFAWIFLMAIFRMLNLRVPLFSGYFSLFAGGCVLAFVYRRGFDWKAVIFLIVAILVSVLEAVERSVAVAVSRGVDIDGYVIAFITILLFFPFLIFKGRSVRLPYARIIGSLTYPFYLLHAYIGYAILSLIGSNESRWIALFFVWSLILAISWLVARYVEESPKKIWKSLVEQVVGGIVRVFYRIRIGFVAK